MPHVDIKCFPRDLNDEEKTALAADIAAAITRHLGSKDGAISVALNQVQQDEWKSQVWDTEIAPQLETLIKKPGYSM
ncbi:tautomerase PptA [Enterobacteriaceae bacterium C23F]